MGKTGKMSFNGWCREARDDLYHLMFMSVYICFAPFAPTEPPRATCIHVLDVVTKTSCRP